MTDDLTAHPLYDTATVITELRNRIADLEHRLDLADKWGKSMAKRWGLVEGAIQAASDIKQEDSPPANYGIVP